MLAGGHFRWSLCQRSWCLVQWRLNNLSTWGGGEQQAAALSVTSHLRWAVATFFAEIVEVIDELLALHSQGVARRHRGHTQSLAPLSVIHYCHHPIGRQISPEMPTPPCLVVALQLSSAAEPVRRGM